MALTNTERMITNKEQTRLKNKYGEDSLDLRTTNMYHHFEQGIKRG